MYLSFSTLSSSFSIILRVVSTPISEVINTSSISSSASSSIVDFPATVLANFPKKLSFVLGCDSANDLNYSYNVSTGGGAALYYIGGKELEIIKKLKKNI